jgi:hypothetical protein
MRGRLGSCGHSQDDGPGYSERIEQGSQSVGLGNVGGVGRQGGAEIPESGRGDDTVVLPQDTPADYKPHVESTSHAMHDQGGRSAPGLGHLHWTACSFHQTALPGEARSRSPQVGPERGHDRSAGPGHSDSE